MNEIEFEEILKLEPKDIKNQSVFISFIRKHKDSFLINTPMNNNETIFNQKYNTLFVIDADWWVIIKIIKNELMIMEYITNFNKKYQNKITKNNQIIKIPKTAIDGYKAVRFIKMYIDRLVIEYPTSRIILNQNSDFHELEFTVVIDSDEHYTEIREYLVENLYFITDFHQKYPFNSILITSHTETIYFGEEQMHEEIGKEYINKENKTMEV